MIKIAAVDEAGAACFIVVPSDDGQYPDGSVWGDHTYWHIPYETDDAEFLATNYWDFEAESFAEREPKPDHFHEWNSDLKEWVLNEELKRRWLSSAVNPARDRLEAGRVVVDGHLIDIDERAEKRMSDALDLWDEMGVEALPWVLGDNTELPVDKAQLQRFYSEGRRIRALRALQLHIEARALKNNINTTQEDIDAWVEQHRAQPS